MDISYDDIQDPEKAAEIVFANQKNLVDALKAQSSGDFGVSFE